MTMTLPTATLRLGRELNAAHTKIDDALVSVAALLHSTAVARVDITEADPSLGHGAMMRMNKSLGDLLSARADMLRAHQGLRSDLTVVSGAEEPTCPERYFTRGSIEAVPTAA